jgi:hypothetical protein
VEGPLLERSIESAQTLSVSRYWPPPHSKYRQICISNKTTMVSYILGGSGIICAFPKSSHGGEEH